MGELFSVFILHVYTTFNNIETFKYKENKHRNMKKSELVYRELLKAFMDAKQGRFTQLGIAKALCISLSTVNNALQPLRKMGAVKVSRRSFDIVNARKILYYWASVRNLEKDVIFQTRVEFEGTVAEIEKQMPPGIVFAGYTAYKFLFMDAPADYSEVYVYCGDKELGEVMKRFPKKNGNPNLFVLCKDFSDSLMPVAHLFVDLWNMKEWYAREFVKATEERINAVLA